MEACPQMLTYFCVRSALGQDIHNSLTKFPAFNEFNAEREIVAIEFAGLNGGSYNIGHYRQFVLLRRACAMRAPTPVSLHKGALSGAP